MPKDWQAEHGPLPCGETLLGYTPFRSYSDRGEGTVILLRDTTFTRDKRVAATYIDAREELGWKTGMVLHAVRCGDPAQIPIALASVHLKWGAKDAQLMMLNAALTAMGPAGPAILAGD